MHNCESVQPGGHVVEHDTAALGKRFQLSHWRRFEDIEDTKKYKARQKGFPSQRYRDQSDQLAGHFIDHHKLRVFFPRTSRDPGCGRNADERDRESAGDGHRGS